MPLPLLHVRALWFQTLIIYIVTFTSAGIKQPNRLILFNMSPKNKLRLHQTSCWLVWTSAQHFVGCLGSTLNRRTVSSHWPVAQPFPASAGLLKAWNILAHFKQQVYCCCVTGGRRKHCYAIWQSWVLGKSSQPPTISYPVVVFPLGWGWGSVVAPEGKTQWKIILNQLGSHQQSPMQGCADLWQPPKAAYRLFDSPDRHRFLIVCGADPSPSTSNISPAPGPQLNINLLCLPQGNCPPASCSL